jgi:hypothetical protein
MSNLYERPGRLPANGKSAFQPPSGRTRAKATNLRCIWPDRASFRSGACAAILITPTPGAQPLILCGRFAFCNPVPTAMKVHETHLKSYRHFQGLGRNVLPPRMSRPFGVRHIPRPPMSVHRKRAFESAPATCYGVGQRLGMPLTAGPEQRSIRLFRKTGIRDGDDGSTH